MGSVGRVRGARCARHPWTLHRLIRLVPGVINPLTHPHLTLNEHSHGTLARGVASHVTRNASTLQGWELLSVGGRRARISFAQQLRHRVARLPGASQIFRCSNSRGASLTLDVPNHPGFRTSSKFPIKISERYLGVESRNGFELLRSRFDV